MDQEQRPDRYKFTSDTPEFYRWYEHGGKPRQKPLNLEEMEKFYLEKGYAPETARAAAWSSGARPKEAERQKGPTQDREENSIEPNQKQEQTRTADEDAKQPKHLTAKSDSKQSANKEEQQAEPGQDIEPKNVFSELDKKTPLVPAHIQKQYLQVGSRFYYEANPDQLAFEDKGNKLRSKSSGMKVAGALVDIAQARGWTEIKARGSEDFRRNVWLDASARGIDVRGYQPKEADLALLEKRFLRATSGKAEKAEAVRKKKPEELVKDHPEMKYEAATLKLAEKVAERFPNKSDQQRFMAQVQDRVAARVEKGLPGAQVKVREVKQVQAVKEERVLGR